MPPEITTSAAYKAAEAYEQLYVANIFRYWTPIFIESVSPQPGEQVLDVACGTGVVARSIVPMLKPGGKVVGLDINPAMLEIACKQFSNHCAEIDWREGQAEKLPLPAGTFDLVVCQQGLQFFKDRPAAAREMHRVLRENGRVGIEVWQSLDNNPFYAEFYPALASVFDVPVTGLAAPMSFGDPLALETLLQEAGFRQVHVARVSQEVRFEHPERFIELSVRGAAAVMPAFARVDAAMQTQLEQAVARKIERVFQAHLHNGVLLFPMQANIATALK
jgi:ubiquinone/menaquinone biosynthesis C-methylase UbiE